MPGTQVNPFAKELALEMGYPEENLRSKSWDEYALPNAPRMDFIVTVCDNAAGEVCPFWPGNPATAHWGYPDPSQISGSDQDKRNAFRQVMAGLRNQLDMLAEVLKKESDLPSLQAELKKIGH
jgi:arsenate reductase (thioredoxin)